MRTPSEVKDTSCLSQRVKKLGYTARKKKPSRTQFDLERQRN